MNIIFKVAFIRIAGDVIAGNARLACIDYLQQIKEEKFESYAREKNEGFILLGNRDESYFYCLLQVEVRSDSRFIDEVQNDLAEGLKRNVLKAQPKARVKTIGYHSMEQERLQKPATAGLRSRPLSENDPEKSGKKVRAIKTQRGALNLYFSFIDILRDKTEPFGIGVLTVLAEVSLIIKGEKVVPEEQIREPEIEAPYAFDAQIHEIASTVKTIHSLLVCSSQPQVVEPQKIEVVNDVTTSNTKESSSQEETIALNDDVIKRIFRYYVDYKKRDLGSDQRFVDEFMRGKVKLNTLRKKPLWKKLKKELNEGLYNAA
jgi:hypothetical protein